ncbi:hypothetical protein OUE_1165 [Helicobacter pylori R030b]|nr:hypothetical protein OUE_1165 [Helicobacter pylori R030b]
MWGMFMDKNPSTRQFTTHSNALTNPNKHQKNRSYVTKIMSVFRGKPHAINAKTHQMIKSWHQS